MDQSEVKKKHEHSLIQYWTLTGSLTAKKDRAHAIVRRQRTRLSVHVSRLTVSYRRRIILEFSPTSNPFIPIKTNACAWRFVFPLRFRLTFASRWRLFHLSWRHSTTSAPMHVAGIETGDVPRDLCNVYRSYVYENIRPCVWRFAANMRNHRYPRDASRDACGGNSHGRWLGEDSLRYKQLFHARLSFRRNRKIILRCPVFFATHVLSLYRATWNGI